MGAVTFFNSSQYSRFRIHMNAWADSGPDLGPKHEHVGPMCTIQKLYKCQTD